MSRLSPNLTGALLMVASMACYTFNDAFVKLAGETIPLFQLLTLRAILATVLLAALAQRFGKLTWGMTGRDRWLVFWRCVAEIASAYFFLTALLAMPLANVTAILQVLPLTVTLAAALIFGESVGWRRMGAILVGFVGMLLIVRPGPDGFSVFSGYALAAVAAITLRDLVTRKLSTEMSTMTVSVITSTAMLLFFGGASLFVEWVPVGPREGALIAGAAVFIMGGYAFSVMVMRLGDVSFSAPFRYSGLVWALLLGWLIFGDWPDAITLLGAGIIVASGLFTLYRGRRVSRS